MQGYEVRTIDGDKIGDVVDTDGDYLIVEHGLLKTKHALPKQLAEIDPNDEVVRTRLPKDVVYDSPKIDGKVDADAVARYYDDAEAFDEPPTRAQGEPDPMADEVLPNLAGDTFKIPDKPRR